MSRVVRVKNVTGGQDTWAGRPINDGAYYTIPDDDLTQWRTLKIFQDVAAMRLIVNNGSDVVDDFTDALKAWNWLYGNLNPPTSADGDWHILNENFAHVAGNQGINWGIERELENEEEYAEKFVLPVGRHATINTLRGGSDRVPSSIVLEWYEELTVGTYMRVNPWVRADELIAATVNGAHSLGATTITLHNTDNEVSNILADHYYCFDNTASGGSKFHIKVLTINPLSDQITVEGGLPENISDGTCIAQTDRAIGRIGNQVASDALDWDSPPNMFYGNGKNYFLLTIKNEHIEDVGVVSATVNGWHTPTSGGD